MAVISEFIYLQKKQAEAVLSDIQSVMVQILSELYYP